MLGELPRIAGNAAVRKNSIRASCGHLLQPVLLVQSTEHSPASDNLPCRKVMTVAAYRWGWLDWAYFTARFSPDGKRLALAMTSGKGTALHVYDSQREAMSHLTFNGQDNFNPVWTPDVKHIVFRTSSGNGRGNGSAIMWIRSDGAGDAQLLHQSKNFVWPSSFTPDGRRLAFSEQSPETNTDLWTLPLDLADPEHPKPGKPEKFWASPTADYFPMFSPDGRWIAYGWSRDGY